MAYLLDTHTLFWWLYKPDLLSPQVSEIIADTEQSIFVSAISAYEIANKYRTGKWDAVYRLAADFEDIVTGQGMDVLAVRSGDATRAALMESDHRDPFDRIIAAQSINAPLILLTKDEKLKDLGAITLW